MTKLTEIKLVPTAELREHEHASLIPEMTADEWAEFLENVRERGEILKPLEILEDGRVVDGRHRLKAAIECGIEFLPVIVKKLSGAEVVAYMRDSGLRRNLTTGQRAAIVLKCEALVSEIREKAEQKIIEAGEHGKLGGRGNKKETPFPNSEKGFSIHTHVELAEKAGIGKSSMASLQAVQRKAPDLFEKVATGEITINKAYTTVKKRDSEKKAPDNVVSFPKKERKRRKAAANKTELQRIHAELVETAKQSEGIDEKQSKFTPDNLLRFRATKDLPDYIGRLVSDYEALDEVSDETFATYHAQLYKALKATLFLAETIEPDPVIGEVLTMMVGLFKKTESEKGYAELKNLYYAEVDEK